MRRFIWTLLLLATSAQAAIYELGGGISSVFLSQTNGEKNEETFSRFSLYGGYQLNAASDQLLLALVSDKIVDELQLGYLFTLPSLYPYSPFSALPYLKFSLGLGNTYADTLTLTHASYQFGAGAYGNITQRLRLRFEMGYRMREWQLDRRGESSDAQATTWEDSELEFHLGLGYLF